MKPTDEQIGRICKRVVKPAKLDGADCIVILGWNVIVLRPGNEEIHTKMILNDQRNLAAIIREELQ